MKSTKTYRDLVSLDGQVLHEGDKVYVAEQKGWSHFCCTRQTIVSINLQRRTLILRDGENQETEVSTTLLISKKCKNVKVYKNIEALVKKIMEEKIKKGEEWLKDQNEYIKNKKDELKRYRKLAKMKTFVDVVDLW